MCGGTCPRPHQHSAGCGLSPRVRGNRKGTPAFGPGAGSIPACAGEPNTPRSPLPPRQVYPRVCGGTRPRPRHPLSTAGLSPRVRGNRQQAHLPQLRRRSIPACAGEPRPYPAPTAGRKVYPRVCGGTQSAEGFRGNGNGLSPRVRGNRAVIGNALQSAGSIPACAGEPITGLTNGQPYRVYPRVCGGTAGVAAVAGQRNGLSPRVRGNRFLRDAFGCDEGSIPACAGEPARCPGCFRRIRVYPRVCGGTAQG